ncbi:hypothetical protein TWF718_001699 [Orbilia javanica]|uniref:ABM domain-containing protein n=1 Tax=Orbilia javanica TaxID=47235 RepID=A0AAN8N5P7_9PEZI
MVTTEVCVFNILPTLTLKDLLSPSHTHQKSLSLVRSQPGCLALYWGIGTQDPQKLIWFIEWDSLSSHQLFQSQPEYPDFTSNILSALTSPTITDPPPVFFLHYNFTHPLSSLIKQQTATKNPYLEYFSLSASPSLSCDTISTTISNVQADLNTYDGGVPSTFNFAIDEGQEHNILCLVCWREQSQHETFIQTEVFRENALKLNELAVSAPVVFHIHLQELE